MELAMASPVCQGWRRNYKSQHQHAESCVKSPYAGESPAWLYIDLKLAQKGLFEARWLQPTMHCPKAGSGPQLVCLLELEVAQWLPLPLSRQASAQWSSA